MKPRDIPRNIAILGAAGEKSCIITGDVTKAVTQPEYIEESRQ